MCSPAPSAPSSTTQTTDLPDWAKPYAKETLAKTSALTDINQNPYQKYGGERIAGFQPMQEQAFKTMSGMDASPEGFAKGIGSYMSPYMQNVVDIQKREAGRQSDIAGTQQQAQATQAGAFGGGRDAIMRAERERNLGQQMNDIQARGSQAAFDQASGQFRQGITQQSGLAQMQGQMGQQQQQQEQRPLDMAYQDFQNQQNYPYKQLGFMSDMVNRLPLGQKSTAQVYDQGPGMVQTLAGLGGAAYGFGKSGMFGAEGGLMESYADGGVTSDQNVESILGRLSDQQLAQAKETALNRRDIEQAQMIDAEMAERASIRGGLGGAFNQIPIEQQEEMMAGGGIVAFAPGGAAKSKDTYGNRFEQSLTDLKAMSNKAPAEQTPEQRDEAISARIPMLEKRYGPDITQPYLEETKSKRAGLTDQMEKDKGLAFAMASLGMLSRKRTPGESQRNQLFSGLGEAGQTFISEVGRLKKENREVDDKLRQSEILLATAQQSRKEGLINKADAEETRAQDLKRDAFKTNIDVQGKVAQLTSGLAQQEMQGANALKVAGITAAVQRETMNKPGELERIMADVEAIRSGKKSFAGKTGEEGAQAYKETLSQVGEARGGYRYLGPDKSPEQAAAIRKQALDDDRVKDAGLAIIAAGSDPVKKQAARENYDRILQSVEQGLRDQIQAGRTQRGPADATTAPAKSAAAVGRTPPPAAVDMLKSDPSGKNRKDFDEIFGPGAAAKALGQ
jgi:hypothetical protein